jgi:hypothetical protein
MTRKKWVKLSSKVVSVCSKKSNKAEASTSLAADPDVDESNDVST